MPTETRPPHVEAALAKLSGSSLSEAEMGEALAYGVEVAFTGEFDEMDAASDARMAALGEGLSPWVAEAVEQSKPLWDQMTRPVIEDMIREGLELGLIKADTYPSSEPNQSDKD